MAVALEQFVQQLADSGVLAPGKLENFVPPLAQPKDVQELARRLIQGKHLTKFQVQEIYQGRAKSLILGNYTLLDKIGAGGMGQVFKAEHRRMHRLVAIKMLPPAVTKDPHAVARFQREVDAAAKLEHPHIVAAYDADEANGVHFLVMQFVDGQDLSASVKKNGPFPLANAINYMLQAARGLEFAHGEGVVHRDIKPANLLLDKKGTVKILDMGLARISSGDDAATQAELTGTGAVLGTVDYMAPEQALSTKHADARADIYSLGCTLHYLLTGKAAYDGDTLMAKLLAHREQPIPALGDDVPEQLQAVFDKMVAKKVEDRYQTMSEVVAALEQCQSGSQSSLGLQQSVGTNPDDDALTFLRDIPARTTHPPKPKATAKPAQKAAQTSGPRKPFQDKRKFILAAVGAGILGMAVLAAVIFKMQTKDGTLVVEINQPDAVVQVLDAEGKVEISQPGGKGPISISVDPGKHRLKIEKDGFQFFAKDFEMDSGGTQTIRASLIPREGKPATAGAKKPLAFQTPGFDQWMKEVAALPAEKQVDAVVKKLKELNPGFDGNVGGDGGRSPKVENGVVTGLGFSTDNVADISPVRALPGLKALDCGGSSPQKGKLCDLSPLKGMRLAELYCQCTAVSDLSPLRGIPLTRLNCSWARVSDLSPLNGTMLDSLDCGGNDAVSDLSPLKGLPLTNLSCGVSQVSDLSPLRGMPLTRLGCDRTHVSDLSPLQGMRLDDLDIGGTNVASLALIKGMPLSFLSCHRTPVSDLSPLHGAPLRRLFCDGTQVSDLSPLEGMSLTELYFTPKEITKGLDVIRHMKSLDKISLRPNSDSFPAAEFWKKYDAGEFGKPDAAAAAPDRKPITTLIDPVFQQWMKGVAALPAEKQVDAVAKKLQELNPGFDGNVTGWDGTGKPRIENGAVTEFGFHTDAVTDLSPVRALKELQILRCSGSNGGGKCKLSDLSPLRGMNLTKLDCGWSQVADLSPLKEMKLTNLNCGGTQVADLSPLQGMRLASLDCRCTAVSDLSPLRGMPLTWLDCSWARATDLSPLNGTMLNWLDCGGNEAISDLSPLKGMPLTYLSCTRAHVSDLSPLKGMPLTELHCNETRVSDLSPLRGLKLRVLDCSENNSITDISPLEGMPLESLHLKGTKVVDLSPLRRMPLVDLGIEGTNVADLSQLKDLRLTRLILDQTKVSDLSPLRGMPLTNLSCKATSVTDLAPLKGIPLTTLICAETPVTDLSPINGMSLSKLSCHHTPVSSLSPLKGMKLTELLCDNTPISDLSPLEGMKLERLAFTPATMIRGVAIARQMQSLQHIGLNYDQLIPAAEFWKRYDAGEFGKPAAAAKATLDDPGFQKWMKNVAALPAEKQVEAVAKKLQELNPAFDGKETHKIENGVVTELAFCSDNVTDMSPVRALPGLKTLRCAGSNIGTSILSDLSPLQGIRLTGLICGNTRVSDLTPLKAMPLETFHCGSSQVADLSPLAGMPLKELWCDSTKVFDLSPLKGMKLTHLSCRNNRKLVNLLPLKGMSLTNLECRDTRVSDLTPLNGMPLRNLDCGDTMVSDLTTLNGMPLTNLDCGSTMVSDLTPLNGMPLTILACSGTAVADLSPLHGMPLKELNCNSTPVHDLSPLTGMKLTALYFDSTKVGDLEPLKGAPLRALTCHSTPVADLSPLKEINLTVLTFTPKNITKGIDAIRQMTSLTTIGISWETRIPSAEFWKKHDAGEFGKAIVPAEPPGRSR